jgi:D-threo-aldose 1-dehydrogenase
VKAVGLGVNEWQGAHKAIRRQDFDCLLLAGRYTLLEQDALDGFLPLCEKNQVSVILGGGYNSGILATGAVPGAKYNYALATEPILERVRKMEQVCREHSVPLKAALQFVLGHRTIPTNIPGVRTVAQLDDNLQTFRADIPPAFSAELKRRELIRQDAADSSIVPGSARHGSGAVIRCSTVSLAIRMPWHSQSFSQASVGPKSGYRSRIRFSARTATPSASW